VALSFYAANAEHIVIGVLAAIKLGITGRNARLNLHRRLATVSPLRRQRPCWRENKIKRIRR
jgi:hypothetical protein